MGLRLAPTLSYCRADAKRIFLDIGRDRYFCLREPLDASFETWAAGQILAAADTTNLATLVSQGVLVETAGPDILPAPCPSVDPPRVSLFDRATPAGALPTAAAYTGFKWSRLRLSICGLAASLSGVERHKNRARPQNDAEARAQYVADAFRGAARYATTRLYCLPHAIAVAHSLAARGAPGHLVIGVRTRPFGAHAWVQLGDMVVNDSIDNVRDFTPIRLI